MEKNAEVILTLLLLLLIASPNLFGARFVGAQVDAACSKVQAANYAVNQAFNSVFEAEKAGANITSLLTKLNDATTLLSRAENAYKVGDSAAALNNADGALLVAKQVLVVSPIAKEDALTGAQIAFWSNVALTVVALVVLILALFIVWRFIKRGYIKSLSGAKPEVVSDETA